MNQKNNDTTSFENIHEYKQKRELDDPLKAKLSVLIENSLDGIIILENEKIDFINSAAIMLFNYPYETLLSLDFNTLLTPESYTKLLNLRLFRNEGKMVKPYFEAEIIRGDNTTAPVEITYISTEFENQSEIIFIRDITERKNAMEVLRKSEERYKDLYNNSSAMFVSVDYETGKVLQCNNTLIEKTGFTREEIVGHHIFERYHSVDTAKEVFQFFSDTGEINDAELQIKKKDGGKIDVILNVTSVRDDDGKILYSRSVLQDITEKKKAEVKIKNTLKELRERKNELEIYSHNLEKAYDSIDKFAYSVSHDLRTPLRAICSYSQIVMDHYGNNINEEMYHYLERIYDGSIKMDQLINDLLFYSKIDTIELEIEELDIKNIVDNVINVQKRIHSERKINFVVSQLFNIKSDYKCISKIFHNLIENAVKFSKNRDLSIIEIGCEDFIDFFQFFIRDNGIGFDMRFKDKLFKEFQKIHSVDSYEGSGIGLATVMKMVEKMGGEVNAEGELGEGSTFYFTIPKA